MYILEKTGPVPLKENLAILKAVNKLTFKWGKKGGKKAAKQGDLCRIGSNNTTGIYDSPVLRPPPFPNTPTRPVTIRYRTRSSLLIDIHTGTHVESRKL